MRCENVESVIELVLEKQRSISGELSVNSNGHKDTINNLLKIELKVLNLKRAIMLLEDRPRIQRREKRGLMVELEN